jgi:diguanylate cyclase (GGDEF)-like protein
MLPAKILVVDDEEELQRLFQQRFRKWIQAGELDLVFAANGKEALSKLQHDQHIDMIITDINMPEMDGLTFIKHLPKINETIRAIIISAHDDMHYIRQAMNEGAFDFLTKPINFQDLQQTIVKTLQNVRQLKDKQMQAQLLEAELRQAAFSDRLTGLPNRRWLYNHLEHLLKQRNRSPLRAIALLFIDLDEFKPINDTFGHLVGDGLLKNVAERLQLCLRRGDLAARWGGDEFVIVLDEIPDIAIAVAVAERIQAQFKLPFVLNVRDNEQKNERQVLIQASIGIVFSYEDYQDPEEILQAADLAMYNAKAQGQGGYVIHGIV